MERYYWAMDTAFQKGMRENGDAFVKLMKSRASAELDLDQHQNLISNALDRVKEEFFRNEQCKIGLQDLVKHGLPTRVARQLGNFAVDYASSKSESFQGELSTHINEESYDEDFEEISDEFEQQKLILENEKQVITGHNSSINSNHGEGAKSGSNQSPITNTNNFNKFDVPYKHSGTSSDHFVSRNVTSSHDLKRRQKTPSWISMKLWKLGEKIGTGSFGEVFQAMNDKGKFCAVKRMSVTDNSIEIDNLLNEIQLMRGLSHQHIVEYLGAHVDTENFYLYIFQEWVPGGSVAELLKKFGPFPLNVVKSYTRQILQGLAYLHENGIIHRDIKGGNILVDDNGIVKLADFGASTTLSSFGKTQDTATIKGTPYFMAPEVLSSSKYGRKGDIWAVGCTIIQMLTGEPPWKDRNLKGLIQLHMLLASWNEPYPSLCGLRISDDAEECLIWCFKKAEGDRPTALQLLKCAFLSSSIISADDCEDGLEETGNTMAGIRTNRIDVLEDSGVISGLRNDIAMAVNRSSVGKRHETQNNLRIAEGCSSPQVAMSPKTAYPNLANKFQNSNDVQSADPVRSTEQRSVGDNHVGRKSPITFSSPSNSQWSSPTNSNPFGRGVTKQLGVQATPDSKSFDGNSAVLTDDFSQQNLVRESLSVIKRKVNERSTGVGNIRRFSNPAINQSTSRDSESLTPLTADDFDSVHQQGANNSQIGEYNEKYFEEKQREPFSPNMESILRKIPMLQREVSCESVEDYAVTGADNDKSEETCSTDYETTPELIFMHTNNNADKIRRRFHPRSSEMSPPRLIKSSSATDSVSVSSVSGRMNKIIPKLSNFEITTRKQTSHPYSQSVSARIIRPDGVKQDSVSRPHTSKAALGQTARTNDSHQS